VVPLIHRVRPDGAVPGACAADGASREPESFDFTNQLTPGPMWHFTQVTRAWGERAWAAASGSITEWQEPQNSGESITSSAL
jgi:hypothetical protein